MIRKFKIEDIDFVMDIWLKGNIKAHDFIDEEYWKDNFEMVKGMIPKADVYVYEDNGCIEGFAGVMDGYIAGIFVRADMQSKGIGKELIEEWRKDYETLSLSVYEKNKGAVSFYLREGFVIDKKKNDESTGEAEYLMVLRNKILIIKSSMIDDFT